jgi:hypothetical protein
MPNRRRAVRIDGGDFMPAKKKVAKKMTTKQMKKTKGGAAAAVPTSEALRARKRYSVNEA